jgi:flagellar motor switch protein FliG
VSLAEVPLQSVLSAAHLSGAEKAAILLLRLGSERSAKVLKLLGENEVTQVTAEIVRANHVRREDSDGALAEFATLVKASDHLSTSGGLATARQLLEASLGESRATEILANLRQSMVRVPFEFLRNSDPRQVLNFLSNEHPQTIALVLAHMPPEHASTVLGGLPEELQRDVSIRIATLSTIAPDVVARIESQLERRLSSVVKTTDTHAADGVQTLIDILNRSDRTTERSIFEGLETHDAELADEVRSRMFVFEDIVSLDDRAVQLVLRQVESKDLATALKGVRDEVRSKIMRNISERAAENLEEEIILLGSVRLKMVEEAQGGIVRVIRALEESGEVTVSRGSDEFVT